MVTHFKYIASPWVSAPYLHVCTLMPQSRYDKKLSKKPLWDFIQEQYGTLTVAKLLGKMPNLKIEKCSFRDRAGHIVVSGDEILCSDKFSLQQYLFQQYICYRIEDRRNHMHRSSFIRQSFYYEHLMSEFFIHQLLDLASKIRVTLSAAPFPYISKNYPFSLYKQINSTTKIQVSCQNLTMIHLGFPYDNYICSDNFSDFFECIETCKQEKSIAMLNMLPYSSFYTTPMNYKLMVTFVDKNRSSDEIMEGLYRDCDRKCIKRSCSYNYCITNGKADNPPDDEPKSSVRVNMADHPDSLIENLPQIKLLDCIVFVLSTLGTWFGLVLISCNPLNVYFKMLEKFQIRQNTVIPIRYVNVTRINHFRRPNRV